MKITCLAFEEGQTIPPRFSKQGGNISPALEIRDVPRSAQSLVLVVDDPDAPHGLFTHWVLYGIDPGVREIRENEVPVGARCGRNSWGEAAYGGPQPPDREHRYFFRLFALDTALDLSAGASRGEVEREMDGHIIAEAQHMGRYAPHTAEIMAHSGGR
jgi:Raf kinase inhibitor-like YbhB/YbcL family protein